MAGRSYAVAWAACMLAACELVRPLPDVNAERGETLCHDDHDNDGDGLRDCDDPSCGVECIEPPRIECSSLLHWTPRTIGETAYFTCDPPIHSPGDECLSTPPADAVGPVLGPMDDLGQMAQELEGPVGLARVAEVWLRPGTYEIDAADFGDLHALVAHGLCDPQGHWPVLRPRVPGNVPMHAYERIQMDHVELVLPPRDSQLVDSDLFRLDHARITRDVRPSVDPTIAYDPIMPPPRLAYVPIESGGAAIELSHVDVAPEFEIFTEGVRIHIEDASTGPMHLMNSRVTLRDVFSRAAFAFVPPTGSDGPLRGRYEQYYAVYADGPATTFDADGLFVDGVIASYAGADVSLSNTVVERWRVQATGLVQQGTTDPFPAPGNFSARDIVVAGRPPLSICDPSHSDASHCWSALNIKTPSDVERVAVVGTTAGANFVGCGTVRDVIVEDVARAHDQPWSSDPVAPWPQRATGLSVGPGVSVERARIRSAGYAGVAVLERWPDVALLASTERCGPNTSVRIDRVSVEGAGEPEPGATCAGASVGVLLYEPYDVRLSNVHVSGVDCGVAIRSSAGALLSDIHVDHAGAALCGSEDLAQLATEVVTDGTTPAYAVRSTDPSVCTGP